MIIIILKLFLVSMILYVRYFYVVNFNVFVLILWCSFMEKKYMVILICILICLLYCYFCLYSLYVKKNRFFLKFNC